MEHQKKEFETDPEYQKLLQKLVHNYFDLMDWIYYQLTVYSAKYLLNLLFEEQFLQDLKLVQLHYREQR